jgi:hypothetical protein
LLLRCFFPPESKVITAIRQALAVWAWGTGRNLIDGDGTPIAMIIAGLFFEGTAVLFASVLLAALRHVR